MYLTLTNEQGFNFQEETDRRFRQGIQKVTDKLAQRSYGMRPPSTTYSA